MKLEKPKGFFGLGFSVKNLMLKYEGKTMVYKCKLFLGIYVLNFQVNTRARKKYVNRLLQIKENKKILNNPCPCGTQRCYPESCEAFQDYKSKDLTASDI